MLVRCLCRPARSLPGAARPSRRTLQQQQQQQQPLPPPANAAPPTLTVVNGCARPLKISMFYPFDNSDRTEGHWCANAQRAWKLGWCWEQFNSTLPPGGTVTSHEHPFLSLGQPDVGFVTAYHNDHSSMYPQGVVQPESEVCLHLDGAAYCECSRTDCFAWFEVSQRPVTALLL